MTELQELKSGLPDRATPAARQVDVFRKDRREESIYLCCSLKLGGGMMFCSEEHQKKLNP